MRDAGNWKLHIVVHFGLHETEKGGAGDFFFFFSEGISLKRRWPSYAQNVLTGLHNFYHIYYMILSRLSTY